MNYCNNKSVSPTLITTIHTKKSVAQYSLKELMNNEMQVLTRGHGSLIGLNCDTGFLLMKTSEKPQLSGIIVIKCRRSAIDKDLIYFKVEEEEYGKGPARFTICAPAPIPPTELEASLYSLFYNNREERYKQRTLKDKMALHAIEDTRSAVSKLLDYKIIKSLSKEDPFSYIYNEDFEGPDITLVDMEYRRQLEEKYLKQFNQDIIEKE